MRTPSPPVVALICLTAGLTTVTSQEPARPDRPVLYLVATAHLDTQWNWTVQDTIRQFVPDTFLTNFKFIEANPNYAFNYEGAIHYMWFKEYYPEEWSRLQKHVAANRWRLSGSWINAADVNVPSPESLMRQALYGRRFFRQEFGKVSQDIFLPDCFGFPFSLPSIARASGLSAFSTQKLTWGRPIPFPIGRWRGVDGSEVVAALNPGSYTTRLQTDISVDPVWATTNYTPLGSGRSVAFRYFGTGDVGGGPTPESVASMEKAIANPSGAIAIRNTSADQLSRDLTDAEKAALPSYEGELILKTHGTGCYTSQAAVKAWNRQNELLADAAERAAVAATWLTGVEYPGERLRDAWIRFLWHQFHDDLTGTSIPQAYQFSWNDELVSLNQFASVLTSSAGAVASLLDTRGTGIPLVVYNPLSTARRDVVEAAVGLAAPAVGVRVTDALTGRSVPGQIIGRDGESTRIAFLADVPSVGFRVFHVSATTEADASSSLVATVSSLENNRLSVKVDRNGDIASIYDKDAKRELLKAPVVLELRDNPSPSWPAWEVLYDVVQAPAREYVASPRMRVVENGPVRAAIEITRRAAGSTFVQIVRLTEGGDRVDVENLVDWKSPNTLLKASFPLAASNPKATYDLGLGTIDRGNNEPDQYEVPAQKWADVTDASGAFGVGIISDSKYGWDKPTDDTLRLTLLHTPRPVRSYTYQSSNDLGHHRFVFAIAGHAGDWRRGRLPLRAAQLDHPLVAFRVTTHPGPLGPSFSMLTLDDLSGQVAVVALKKAEESDEFVVRLQEQYGLQARTTVRLPAGIAAVREINAAEDQVGPFAQPQPGGRAGTQAPGSNPNLVVDLKPYQPRTLAFRLQIPTAGASADAPPRPTAAPTPGSPVSPGPPRIAPLVRASVPIALPFNLDGVSLDADRSDGDFDGARQSLAGELLPQELRLDGVTFKLGSSAPGAANTLVPRGDPLRLPEASFDRVYVLAAAVAGDVRATFGVGPSATRTVTVREWQGPIGQWDSRLSEPSALRRPFVPANSRGTPSQQEIQAGLVVKWNPASGEVSGMDRIRPGFVKRDEIAWVGTHTHAPDGNQVYVASYLFVYAIDLPSGAREIRLPTDSRLRILAMTLARGPDRVRPARALYVPDLPEPTSAMRSRRPRGVDR